MTTADDLNSSVTGVDKVVIPAELARRPSRPPDYAAENRALSALAQEMATNPRGVLQICAELVLELCRADSAGVSLLEPGGENNVFRRHAVVGGLADSLGGNISQEASSQGVVIVRNRALLFREAEQVLPELKGTQPHGYETLLAAWHHDGKPVGALWAIKHTPDGRFDAEDARLLQSLTRFAAAAHRVTFALEEARTGREELKRLVEERTRPLSEAYDSVRASETRLRTALEIETVGVIYLDPEGRIIDANDAFLAMGGYSHDDLAAGRLTWQGLTPPEWMEASEQAIAELKATGRTTPYEKEYFRRDGSRWWALFAAKRLPDGTIFEFVLDLTSRRQAEERLQESEERFRSLVESWAQAVWETDAEGRVITDSPSWRAYTGQSLEEWLGTGWANAIHPDDRAAVQRLWCDAVRARRPLNTEHRLRRAAGGWRWTNVHAAPLLGPDGTVRKWVGMNIDITERKEAEEALRASEERFRQFGEASTDVLWIRNAETLQWEYLSPAFEAVYGESRERALAGNNLRNWSEQILPEDRDHALDSITRVRAGERVTFEFRITRSDGQMRWMRDTDFPLLDQTGRVQRIGGIGQDITERKQAEEALRASEGRARLLLGELQHRVRNTLAVIRSITRRTAETSTSVEDYAMHLDGRINAFARVQTAVARDPTAGLDLTDLVADELLTYVAHDGEQVKIAGPAVRLKPKAAETFGLAVHELATNAVKHGALSVPQGRIRIAWRVQNGSDPPRLVFEWKESGLADRTAKRRRRGFGTDLLERTLTYELKAKTVQTFELDGLRCTIELPMTERIVLGDTASTPEPD
jgi:PAS domain S-box-containing protein